MKKFLLPVVIILFLFFCDNANGQFYSEGGDPTNVKWLQIKSENYTVIYPREIDSLAREYVTLLENNRSKVMHALSISPKHLPVVLHPYTTKSNGFVSWAPGRMELYTSPDPYSGSTQSWNEHLVIHESRHVGQIYHFTQGGFKYLSYIFGEQIAGLGSALYPSSYALEGDAVVAETQFTKSGRGREADFLQYYRMAFVNGDFRTWDRWRFGSYQYYTPSVYPLGYIINSTILMQTGNDLFQGDVLQLMAKEFYNPAIIGKSYKKAAGKTRTDFFYDAQKNMSEYWKKDMESRGEFTSYEYLSNSKEKLYTEYISPIRVSCPGSKFNERIIAVKWGIENYRQLVSIDTTGRERIISPFNYYASQLSYSNKRIYWSESSLIGPNDLNDYSIIRYLDLYSGKIKTLTHKTKYFNPCSSITGDSLAVAEYPISGSSYLVFLNSSTGQPLSRFEAPSKGQILEPAFSPEGIYCSIVFNNGLGIQKLDKDGWKEIVPPQFQTIRGLRHHNGNLYFQSDLDGICNIYCYEIKNNLLFRLVNSKYGASSPFYDEKTKSLVYSELELIGLRAVATSIDSLQWKIASFKEPYRNPVAEFISDIGNKGDFDTLKINGFDKTAYPSKKYGKFSHLFRFHSWAPVYYNVDKIKAMSYETLYDLASLGATVYSQNTLGTAITMLGYSYHKGFHSGHFKFSYSGFDPVFEISADFNNRNPMFYDLIPTYDGINVFSHTQYDTPFLRATALAYLPINLNRGGWYGGLIPQISWSFNNDSFFSYTKNRHLFMNDLSYGIRYYRVLPTSNAGVFPRWGLGVTAMGATSVGTVDCFGSTVSLSSYFYLPGITKKQGIKLTGSVERQFADKKFFYLTTFTSMPRGYVENLYFDTKAKATFDYAIPIYAGDFSLSSLLYVKRFQIIPFADALIGMYDNNNPNLFYSVGGDFLVDFFVFGFNVPISIGVRYAYTGPQSGNRNYVHFLFNFKMP